MAASSLQNVVIFFVLLFFICHCCAPNRGKMNIAFDGKLQPVSQLYKKVNETHYLLRGIFLVEDPNNAPKKYLRQCLISIGRQDFSKNVRCGPPRENYY